MVKLKDLQIPEDAEYLGKIFCICEIPVYRFQDEEDSIYYLTVDEKPVHLCRITPIMIAHYPESFQKIVDMYTAPGYRNLGLSNSMIQWFGFGAWANYVVDDLTIPFMAAIVKHADSGWLLCKDIINRNTGEVSQVVYETAETFFTRHHKTDEMYLLQGCQYLAAISWPRGEVQIYHPGDVWYDADQGYD